MKLPGINYSTPVQSLGRENISAPLSKANAEANAILTLGGAADKIIKSIDANKIAVDASKFQAAMSELNATMKTRKSYTTEELDSIGVKYDKQYGKGKLESVPAYLVSKQIYKSLTSKIYKMSTESTSKKGRAVISKMYGQMYKEGITPVIVNSIKDAHSIRSVENEISFDSAADTGNAEAANIIASTALATGVWSAEKYQAKTKDMPNKIARGKYLNSLNLNDDLAVLETQLDSALSDPDLSSANKAALFSKFTSKIKTIEKANIKKLKEQNDVASYENYMGIATSVLDNGAPLPWQVVNAAALEMRPTEGKALLALNRSMATKGVTTNPKTHTALAVQIRSISLPSEVSNVGQRRKAAVESLIAAVENYKISPKDFMSMFDQINKAQSFVYDNPEVKRKSDFIWTTLTGGSKDMMTSLFGTGPDTINAVEAEAAMLEAARQQGPGFSPDQWWDNNGTKYLTRSIEENETSLKENRLDKYVIKNGIVADGGIDMKATVEGIRKRVKSGSMSKAQGDNAVKEIYNYQKKRINRNKLITKGGSK